MSVLSRLSGLGGLRAFTKTPATLTLVQRGMSGGPRTMNITPSRWQWHKFKDMIHFYVMLGVIPLSIFTLCVNLFIGPAKLAPIPEDYTPNNWEYYSHPISRFLARYVYTTHQQDYEKFLHFSYEEEEKRQMRLLETKVRNLMKEKNDIQAFHYRPMITRYHKEMKEEYENLQQRGF